jgi:hypothetical protein
MRFNLFLVALLRALVVEAAYVYVSRSGLGVR